MVQRAAMNQFATTGALLHVPNRFPTTGLKVELPVLVMILKGRYAARAEVGRSAWRVARCVNFHDSADYARRLSSVTG